MVQNDVKTQHLKADAVAPWWLAGAAHSVGVQHMGLSNYQSFHHQLLARVMHENIYIAELIEWGVLISLHFQVATLFRYMYFLYFVEEPQLYFML